MKVLNELFHHMDLPKGFSEWIKERGYSVDQALAKEKEFTKWMVPKIAPSSGESNPTKLRESVGSMFDRIRNRTLAIDASLSPDEERLNESQRRMIKLQKLAEIINGFYRTNTCSNQIEKTSNPGIPITWQKVWLDINTVIDASAQDVKHIVESGLSQEYNPIADYLTNLPPWRGNKKSSVVQQWLDCAPAKDKELFDWTMRKALYRAVRQVLKGETNREVPILQGEEEHGKSSFLEWLSPREEWLCIGSLSDKKDSEIRLAGNFIWAVSEIDKFLRKTEDISDTKDLISKTFVNVRLPYGKADIRRKRTASLFGSVNPTEILKHGRNSRYAILPLEDKPFNWKEYEKLDKASFWSEVKHFAMRDKYFSKFCSNEKLKKRQGEVTQEAIERTAETDVIDECFEFDSSEKMSPTTALNHLISAYPNLTCILARASRKRVDKEIWST